MNNYTLLDVPDQLRSLATLLAASLEMDENSAGESQIATELIDIALVRVRKLMQDLEVKGDRHA